MTFEELKAAGFVRAGACSICGGELGYMVHPFLALAVFCGACDCCPAGEHSYRALTQSELAEIPKPARPGVGAEPRLWLSLGLRPEERAALFWPPSGIRGDVGDLADLLTATAEQAADEARQVEARRATPPFLHV